MNCKKMIIGDFDKEMNPIFGLVQKNRPNARFELIYSSVLTTS